MTSPVNVDVKLGVNKFNVDEEHPHIVVKSDADKQALELLVKACPAGHRVTPRLNLYPSLNNDDQLARHSDYARLDWSVVERRGCRWDDLSK